MEIILTPEQKKEFVEDGWLEVKADGHRVYIECSRDGGFNYGEIVHSKNGKTIDGYCFDCVMLGKLSPKKVQRSYYYNHEPQCPSCSSFVGYKFDCCPRCGQALDWRED